MTSEERNSKLAEVKSSIQMLMECKEKVENNKKLDSKTKKDRLKDLDEAINENYTKARLQYQATKKEIDEATFGTVSDEYRDKYEKRLKSKGLTDEQVRQKEQAVIMDVSSEEEGKKTKRHRRTKRTEQRDDEDGFDPTKIERVQDEEELMRKSMVKTTKELERRRHKTTDTMTDVPPKTKIEETVGEIINDKKISPREEVSSYAMIDGQKENDKGESKRVLEQVNEEDTDYKFDSSSIPSYIQYDVLPLPSKGECYPHKKSRIPVAYLTAADENIIASPNMYRDGKLIDTILSRKILDKDIKVEELCRGDKDAIVLWLRATGYGPDFPIEVRHPETQKIYPVNVKLDTFKYYPFNLKGDENGYFDYETSNGDIIKFKYLGTKDEDNVKNKIISSTANLEMVNISRYIRNIESALPNSNIQEGDKKELLDCIADMRDILEENKVDVNFDKLYENAVTNQMLSYTVSVNGNTDPEYIKNYIENMRSRDSFGYRTYVNDNTPGVNLKIKVSVPQSDGGGTFATFLGIDDYVFSNI